MKHSFLRQISACVGWRGIRTLLNKKYTKTQNATGNPAYDALMMFKILLLQTWYGLSDYEVEERINDSLLFSELHGHVFECQCRAVGQGLNFDAV